MSLYIETLSAPPVPYVNRTIKSTLIVPSGFFYIQYNPIVLGSITILGNGVMILL